MKRKVLSIVAMLCVVTVWGQEDVTSTYLKDANLQSLSGWTLTRSGNGNNKDYENYKTDGDVPVVEYYHTWTGTPGSSLENRTWTISQKATLPAGDYRIAINAFYRESEPGTGENADKAYIFAGEQRQNVIALNANALDSYTGSNDLYKAANAFSRGAFSNEFDFTVTAEQEISIGLNVTINTGRSWCIFGPVKLYKYSLDAYLSEFNDVKTKATSLYDTPMNADVLNALKTAAEVENSTLTTTALCKAAINSLKTAIADAETSIAVYTTLKGILDASGSIETTGAFKGDVNSFNTAVSAAQAAYENKTATNETATNLQNLSEKIQTGKNVYAELAREVRKAKLLNVDVTTQEALLTAEEATGDQGVIAIQEVKVNKYNKVSSVYPNYVELETWTTTGPCGSLSGEHWSGDSNRSYLEQSSQAWGSSSWDIGYTQNLTLPAGKYVFMVAGRKAVGDGCALKLVVTNNSDNSELGSVDDFPEGNTGLGINKAGATSFDAADEAGFANNGNGHGWGWRYVPFTLDTKTSINIAVTANATVQHQWVSFCDAMVRAISDATKAKIICAAAADEAETINITANVGPDAFQKPQSVATALSSAISNANDAVENENITKTEVEAIVAALTTAKDNFTNATLNAPAQDVLYSITLSGNGHDTDGYSATFRNGVNTEGGYGISFLKSGVIYAQAFKFTPVENKTNTYTVSFTDNDGATRYLCTRADYGSGGTGTFGIRTTDEADKALEVVVEATSTEGVWKIRNTKADNYFGWQSDDSHDLYTVDAHSGLRMNAVSKASVSSEVTDAQWATLMLPFAADVPDGLTVYSCEALQTGSKAVLALNQVTSIKANTPYIVNGTANTLQFSDYGLAIQDTYTSGLLTGTYAAMTAPEGSYVLQNQDGKVAFYRVGSDVTPTVGANRAYLTLPAEMAEVNALRLLLPGDEDATAISEVTAESATVDVYSLSGVLVRKGVKASEALNGLQKGIYVVNGVKKAVK